MKKWLFIIFVFLNYHCWGSNMITVSSTVPSQLTVCGAAKVFTISIYNPSPFLITMDTLKVTIPNGIEYQTGSITGATYLNTILPNTQVFLLSNIPSLTSQNITFTATATCAVLTYISGGGIIKNNIRIDYTANNNINYTSTNTSLYLIKQPYLTITTIINQSYAGNIGDVFTRCITIVNAGSGELSDFTLTDIHGSGIQITAVNAGVLTNIGSKAKIALAGSDFSSIGNGNNLFENGESITICETVTVLNCISASSDFKAFWGCSVNYCQASVSSANVIFPNYIPNLVITPTSSMNSCIGTGNASPQQLRIVNEGFGNATNVQLDIFQATGGGYNPNVGSNIDPTSFTYQTGFAGMPIPITPTNTIATAALACMSNPVGKVSLTGYSINAGDTVYIKWKTYSCCWDGCSGVGQDYINGWRYNGSYQSICQNTYIIEEAWGRVYSQIYGDLTPDGSPSTMTNGQTGTFNFLFSNYYNTYPAEPGAYWKFEFALPPLPCLTYSNIRILSFDGITTWTPSSVVASGDTVTAIFNGSPPFTLSQADVKINLTLNCAGCIGTDSLSAVSVRSFFVPNNTCGCQIGVSCQSSGVSIICPGPCPAGMFFNYFDITRTSYGLPDNEAGGGNGIPDGVGSLDFTKIKTNRAMFGDTVSSMFTGVVYTNFAHPTLQYCYASSSISNGNLLSFLDAELFIYRGGTLFATCTNFTPLITTTGTNRTFLFDLSVPTLISSGCLPGGYTNLIHDSLVFKPRYKVTVNPGGAILNCYASNKFYLSNIVNPTLASDKYQCGKYNGNFSVVGYFFTTYGSDSYYVRSCNNTTVSQNYYLSIGPGSNNYAGGNLFPYEYRNWAHIKILTAIVPAGYTFISARFNQLRTAGTLAINTSLWQTITPLNPNSDTLNFPVEQYFESYGGTIPLGDDGFYGTLEVTIQPGCKVTPSIYQGIRYDWTFAPTSYLSGPGSDTTFLSGSDQIIYDPPVLFLQSQLPTVFALNTTTSWDISISNTSNVSNALNAWISGPVISGVTIVKVFDLDSNAIILPTGSVYHIGAVNATAVRKFRLTATYTSCSADSIIIYSGWDCASGYPASVQTYHCTPEAITLTLTPLTPAFAVNCTGPPSSIQLCDTAKYIADGVNIQLGTAYNVSITATLPEGATLVLGSSQLSYPVSNPYFTISDPTLISGTTWKWNISTNDSLIGINGLKGILDTLLNSFKLKFNVITDCGYTSGSSLFFVLTGEAACGLSAEMDMSMSPPLYITGATDPYATAVQLKTTYISPCANNSTMRVVVHNHGPATFGNSDSVVVILPVGVSFVGSSFAGIYNAPANGTPLQYTLNGNKCLVWKLPTGTAAGDSTVFTFGYKGDPQSLACDINFFEAKTYLVNILTCLGTGNSCRITIFSGDTTLATFTYKAYLTLSNANASAIPNSPGGETVTVHLDITNTGQAILIDADSIIQFYYDANGNGIYNTGDVFITEDTILIPKDSTLHYSTTFNVPAGQACSIIAVVDPAANHCVCDPSQVLIHPVLISLGRDSSLCSGNTITLSYPPITSYTYNWTPITGLSDTTIANPILTTSNITSAPITTSYILTTSRIGCVSKDTINITVNPIPISNAGSDITMCPYNTGHIGTVSTPGYAYNWLPAIGLSSATLSNPIVAITNPSTTIYIVTTSALGCFSKDTVVITVNPIPVSNAGADILTCATNVSQNIGAASVSGYVYLWSPATGLSDTTVSNPIVILSIAGITTYVVTTSALGCSSSDTCVVKINSLPIPGFTHNDVCFKDSMHFTNTSSVNLPASISGYLWDFGDGSSTSNLKNPAHDYSNYGTYTVILVATTADLCSDAVTHSVNVFDPPHSAFTFVNTCFADSALFTNTSISPTMGSTASWSWNFGDSSPLNTNVWSPQHNYSILGNFPGNFQVTLITHSSNLGCADTFQTAITMFPMPIAKFGFTNICLHQPMPFQDSSIVSSGSIAGWSWNFGDGSSLITTQHPSHTYASPGTFVDSLIITTNNGCKDTVVKSVVVHPLPVVQFSRVNVCDGTPVHFTDQSSISPTDTIQSWRWNFGDGSFFNTNQNTSHLYAIADSFHVQLLVVSKFGCKDSITKTSVVNPNPVVKFKAIDTIGCEPLCVSFQDLSIIATGGIVQWIWNFGDGSPVCHSQNFVHCYHNNDIFKPDTLTVSLTAISDSGCVSTGFRNDYITVYPNPNASFTAQPTTTTIINPVISFTDLSTGANFWSWNFGDHDTASQQYPIPHTYADTGTYTIMLITSTKYGCTDSAYQNIIIAPDFVFYVPNAFTPNDDGVNDTFSGKGIFIKKYEMMIFDRWGNLVFLTDDINKGWDGKANHGTEIAQMDVYVWKVTLTDVFTKVHNYIGTVTLVK